MSKILWHTIQIKVPGEMIELTKTGKVSIKKTLTKTFNISKSQKKPAIKLIAADINKPQIINDGKEWNVEKLKSQMVKANALAKKNKGRDITKSEKRVSKLEKFKKAVVDSAREGVKKNIDKKYDELISSVKKMKSIKLKETPPEDDDFDKISSKLQKLLYSSGQKKIIKALLKLKFKGRIQTNPMLRTLQILQNFNTIDKMKNLIKELEAED